jgi:hypothetical protein
MAKTTDEKRGRGRPQGNGKGQHATRERVLAGDVIPITVHIERADYAALALISHTEERSVSAQIRWVVKQYMATHKKD